MQQGDYTSSYYQYYQSNFQNPNPSSNPNDPYINSSPATHASAPPISSSYTSSNYPSYSSTYPPHPHNPDPAPNIPPTAPVYPPSHNSQSFNQSLQPSSFPHFPSSQQAPYYAYDQNHTLVNYDPSSHSHNYPDASTLLNYENPYENSAKFHSGGGYFDENSGRYETEYDRGGFHDQVIGGGVYAYEGGKVEPYGARGTGSQSSTSLSFDDYGRPINLLPGKERVDSGPSGETVIAKPKAETQEDVNSGVRKFRVMLLAETVSQSNMDVLCQIGLDGIRMLDPATSRTLRIYPLEMVARWEVLDSSIFAFWAKSSTDIEPRRIRLRSNSYTTNTILDTVTAATVQLKEMGGRNKPSDTSKGSEQLAEKKKGFADWMNLMKPSNEEKDYWVPDEAVTKCTACGTDFGAFVRKHHCRNCGDIFCDKCTQGRIALTADEQTQPVRVCDRCMAEVTQRLSDGKEAAGEIAGLQSHGDLAKKLQEEMDRNRQTSSGFKSDGSVKQMREVACPTCTVHLQVQVPTSGSKTIECSVCQHPFLVNAQ